MRGDAVKTPAVVFWPIQHVRNLLVRVRLGEHQLQSPFSINLVHVCIIQVEERESVRGRSLKESGRDEAHAYKRRPAQDRINVGFAHPLDYLLERNGGQGFHSEHPYVVGVAVIGILELQMGRPRRLCIPPMADYSNSSNSIADWFGSSNHTRH